MLKTWAFSSKATTHDWAQLSSAVLECGPQLHWRCFLKEEARILEQQEKAKGTEISIDQILGEGLYSDPQDQALYNDHTLSLCTTAALKAWDRIQELGKGVESYLMVKKGQRETFSEFLQRLTRDVEISITDPEARHTIIESLAYENANTECKEILGP